MIQHNRPAAAILLFSILAIAGCGGGYWDEVGLRSDDAAIFSRNAEKVVIMTYGDWPDSESTGRFSTDALRAIRRVLEEKGYEVDIRYRNSDIAVREGMYSMGKVVIREGEVLNDKTAYLEVYTYTDAQEHSRTYSTQQEVASVHDASGNRIGSVQQPSERTSSWTVYSTGARGILFFGDREIPIWKDTEHIENNSGYDFDRVVEGLLSAIPRRDKSGRIETKKTRPPMASFNCSSFRSDVYSTGLGATEKACTSLWHQFRLSSGSEDAGSVNVVLDQPGRYDRHLECNEAIAREGQIRCKILGRNFCGDKSFISVCQYASGPGITVAFVKGPAFCCVDVFMANEIQAEEIARKIAKLCESLITVPVAAGSQGGSGGGK